MEYNNNNEYIIFYNTGENSVYVKPAAQWPEAETTFNIENSFVIKL